MYEVEAMRPDGYAALTEVRRMAFGATEPHDPAAPRLPEDRFSCIYDGDRILASARTRDFGQWFGGRVVPTGGLSGVVIVTDRRRVGLGKAVVTHQLEAMRARGEVLSSLFATTAALYRSLGYEIAGQYGTRRVALEALPDSDNSLDWAPTRFDDPTVKAVAAEAGRAHDGWLILSDTDWAGREHFFSRPDAHADIYLGTRRGAPVATVCVQYQDKQRGWFGIGARVCSAADDGALREALAFLRRHATTASHADFHLPSHLLEHHVDPRDTEVVETAPFMSRITDVAGALIARGWNPEVATTVDLEVHDPLLAANSGCWRISAEGGDVSVEPGGDGTVKLGIGALSAWYTGAASPARLRAAGLASCDDAGAARMAALVSGGEPPSVIDYF